jgi:hypothetical protein
MKDVQYAKANIAVAMNVIETKHGID